jgi:hypothetical protein
MEAREVDVAGLPVAPTDELAHVIEERGRPRGIGLHEHPGGLGDGYQVVVLVQDRDGARFRVERWVAATQLATPIPSPPSKRPPWPDTGQGAPRVLQFGAELNLRVFSAPRGAGRASGSGEPVLVEERRGDAAGLLGIGGRWPRAVGAVVFPTSALRAGARCTERGADSALARGDARDGARRARTRDHGTRGPGGTGSRAAAGRA